MINGAPGGDSKILFIPAWVRWIAFSILFSMIVASIALFVFGFYREDGDTYILVGASIAELAGTALLIILFALFVERGRSRPRVENLSEVFFIKDVPSALSKISYAEHTYVDFEDHGKTVQSLVSKTKIRIKYARGNFLADYIIDTGAARIALRVEANVKRIGVIYKLPGPPGAAAEAVFESFRDTWSGAADAGYHVGVERDVTEHEHDLAQTMGWPAIFAKPLHLNRDDSFMYDEVERQYVAQDIAVMTKALISEALLDRKIDPPVD